ncbi:hypothetical protein B0H13DRAFT_1867122 [Mycena leptocephala]|nr:hypothetical protein B0H13DRAFT_1867122 [Mycena leptocephala]
MRGIRATKLDPVTQALVRVVPAKKLYKQYKTKPKIDCIMLALDDLGTPPDFTKLKNLFSLATTQHIARYVGQQQARGLKRKELVAEKATIKCLDLRNVNSLKPTSNRSFAVRSKESEDGSTLDVQNIVKARRKRIPCRRSVDNEICAANDYARMRQAALRNYVLDPNSDRKEIQPESELSQLVDAGQFVQRFISSPVHIIREGKGTVGDSGKGFKSTISPRQKTVSQYLANIRSNIRPIFGQYNV